jgi:hypothetical protein
MLRIRLGNAYNIACAEGFAACARSFGHATLIPAEQQEGQMAKDQNGNAKGGGGGERTPRFRFLRGLIVGLLIGLATGWWFRPPATFDDFRQTTSERLGAASGPAKQDLADALEKWAEELREQPD